MWVLRSIRRTGPASRSCWERRSKRSRWPNVSAAAASWLPIDLGLRMIAVVNSLPVEAGAGRQIVARLAQSRGDVPWLPPLWPPEVLRSGGGDGGLGIA